MWNKRTEESASFSSEYLLIRKYSRGLLGLLHASHVSLRLLSDHRYYCAAASRCTDRASRILTSLTSQHINKIHLLCFHCLLTLRSSRCTLATQLFAPLAVNGPKSDQALISPTQSLAVFLRMCLNNSLDVGSIFGIWLRFLSSAGLIPRFNRALEAEVLARNKETDPPPLVPHLTHAAYTPPPWVANVDTLTSCKIAIYAVAFRYTESPTSRS